MSRVAVVGAGGIIGPAIVATLAGEDAVDEIACLDMNGGRAGEVADRHGGGKATGRPSISATAMRPRGHSRARPCS